MFKNDQARQEKQIDRGVLRILRIYVAIQCVAQSLLLLVIRRHAEPNAIVLFNWILSFFYCAYLLSGWLQRMLKHYYIPIALIVTSIGPILSQIIITIFSFQANLLSTFTLINDPQIVYSGQLVPLALPLLLISTQYGLRILYSFTLGTTALSMIQVLLLLNKSESAATSTLLEVMARLLLFSIVGTIIVLLSEEKRKQQRELAQKNERLAQYAVTLEQLAVSRERNRMARELHDTLAHTLSALNIQLKALDVLQESDQARAKNMIKHMQQTTHEGLQEARGALQALRANPPEDLGLVLALKQLAEQSAEWGTIQLDLTLPVHIVGISREIELQFYRIAEEAFHNITRHAQANHVSLALRRDKACLELTIKDDGIGFDIIQQAENGHYGLVGMHERAALINATLSMESKAGQGTSIRLSKIVA